jgi:hypothetical protein
MDEIKNRQGIFILHADRNANEMIVIKETPLLLTTITKELKAKDLSLGNDCFLFTILFAPYLLIDKK